MNLDKPALIIPTLTETLGKHNVICVSDAEIPLEDSATTARISRLDELQEEIGSRKILLPNTQAYANAVFIGNLLYQSREPLAVVAAESVSDVQAAVRFARRNDFKLTVKNGGHSYAGYCLNKGGIVLDVSRMNQVDIDKENMAVTLQCGATWKNAYDLLKDESNYQYMVVGGQCPSVGVSGFTLGGGLSPFSRSYGLGIDNVLQITVVTAEGEFMTLSRESVDKDEQDLFWALNGGGGGNFGVVVEFKSRLHKLRDPNGRVCCGQLSWNLPEQEAEYKQAMQTFNTMGSPPELTIDAIWRYDSRLSLYGQMTIIYNGNMEKCAKTLAPLLRFGPKNTMREMFFTEWAIEIEDWDLKSMVYHNHVSLILPEGAITGEFIDKILALLSEATAILKRHRAQAPTPIRLPYSRLPSIPLAPSKSSIHMLWDNIGHSSARVPCDATPFYWRAGVYVLNIKVQWTSPDQADEMFRFAQKCREQLQPHAIDGKASYLNYIDDTLLSWEDAYYGKNHARLQRVKARWDPTHFWDFQRAVKGLNL